jgi:O-antigen/teichoic acid export membrane protein
VLRLKLVRPQFRFSAANLASSVADFAGKSAPVLIVGGMLGVQATGHYSMAYQLTRIADMVVLNPVSVATFSSVAIAAHRNDAASFVTAAWKILILILAPLFLGLALTADPLAPLFLGPRWTGTASVLAALSPGAFLVCLYGFVRAALLGSGRAGSVFTLTLLTGGAISLGTLAGVRYGVVCAAVGFSAGALVVAPLYLRSLARAMHTTIFHFLSGAATSFAAAAAMACVILAIHSKVSVLAPLAQLGFMAAMGAATFAGVAAILSGKRILSDFERLRQQTPEKPALEPAAWRFLPLPLSTENS